MAACPEFCLVEGLGLMAKIKPVEHLGPIIGDSDRTPARGGLPASQMIIATRMREWRGLSVWLARKFCSAVVRSRSGKTASGELGTLR